MPDKGQRARLEDVLNYKPEHYFSDGELALIRNTFSGNPGLMKVLRKVLIPTIHDPELPIEQFGDDLFLVGRNYDQIPDGEIKSIVLARQDAIKFIAGALVKLQVIANTKELTPEQRAVIEKKNSSK